jgi:hypothetical protein
MRRLLLPLVLACVLAPAAPAAAHPRASVTLDRCVTGRLPDDRHAVFVARMRAVPDADRLQVRFFLQEHGADGRWTSAGALGGWNTSDPKVSAYVFTKRVERLAPGRYRAVARHRWLDASGVVLASARRVSRVCRQPDLRANLRPVGIEVLREADGSALYRVRVRNTGLSPSGAFEVSVAAGPQPLPTVVAPGAAAGKTTVVELRGPACPPGEPVGALVDPAGVVAERREDDNDLVVPCPAS